MALKRLGRPANERDYLMNFIQKSGKSRKSHMRAKKFRKFKHHARAMSVQEDPAFDDPPR